MDILTVKNETTVLSWNVGCQSLGDAAPEEWNLISDWLLNLLPCLNCFTRMWDYAPNQTCTKTYFRQFKALVIYQWMSQVNCKNMINFRIMMFSWLLMCLITDEDDACFSKDCWICYDSDRQDVGPFIQPCQCRGDVSSVHHDCLRRWLVEVCINSVCLVLVMSFICIQSLQFVY
jgi:hypothetical protein